MSYKLKAKRVSVSQYLVQFWSCWVLPVEDSITALLYEEKHTEQKTSTFPKSLVITIISSESFRVWQGKDLSSLGGFCLEIKNNIHISGITYAMLKTLSIPTVTAFSSNSTNNNNFFYTSLEMRRE